MLCPDINQGEILQAFLAALLFGTLDCGCRQVESTVEGSLSFYSQSLLGNKVKHAVLSPANSLALV